jgi:hypothetical protein
LTQNSIEYYKTWISEKNGKKVFINKHERALEILLHFDEKDNSSSSPKHLIECLKPHPSSQVLSVISAPIKRGRIFWNRNLLDFKPF